jgi:ribonuclease Z
MKLTILGNNSALPAYGRHPTAQLLEINHQYFLIDCGEGTQMQFQKYNIKYSRINHLFISHMHGDHYFGLIGLLNTFSLLGRERDLHIFAPPKLEAIIALQLDSHLGYKIIFTTIEDDVQFSTILETDKWRVDCFLVNHSMPTHGFLFTEKKRKRILLTDKVQQYEIPKYFYTNLTNGENYTNKDGTIIKNEEVTTEGLPEKKYAFAADTCYDESILDYIKNVNLLYHETTYLDEQKDKALLRKHSTSIEAATIALKANVKQLIIGHFSSKYKYLEPFLVEATSVFQNTTLAEEGCVFEV